MITTKPNKLPQLQTITFQDLQTLSNDFTSQPFLVHTFIFCEFHLNNYPAAALSSYCLCYKGFQDLNILISKGVKRLLKHGWSYFSMFN